MIDYEKKYNEALERAKHALDCDKAGLVTTDRVLIESMFPELKESEDEKIRKELIKALSSIGKRNWGGIDVFESIAWLEKQGEKKVPFVDFNAKDWYVSKVDGKIHNINISSEKQGEKKPINPNAIKDLERAILAAHPTFKQKPTWSGEDERMVEEILDAIEAAEYEMALNMSDVRQWLKNLKQRLS